MSYKFEDITFISRRQRFTVDYYHPSWNSNYRISDVLVGKEHLYICHMNLDYITVYNKNPDGTVGSRKTGRLYWRGQDSYLTYICAFNSSVPYGFAMYIEDGKDYLVGWSSSHHCLFRWEIDPVTFYPKNRTQFNVSNRAASGYSRGGWDGGRYVYFFNQNGYDLWRWDLYNKNNALEHMHDLNNDWGLDSSWTGSGLLVCNDKMYWGDGCNEGSGVVGCYDLKAKAWRGVAHANYIMPNISSSSINGNTGNISFTALHPNVAYYFVGYRPYLDVLEIDNPYVYYVDTLTNTEHVHAQDIKVSFSIDESREWLQDKLFKYRITNNDIQIYPDSEGYIENLKVPFEQCIEIPNGVFSKVGKHTPVIELIQQDDDYLQYISLNVYVDNEAPIINTSTSSDVIHDEYLTYQAVVTGEHTDKFEYRIKINGDYLEDWSTSKYSSPMTINRSFRPSIFTTGDNTITIEVKEYFKDSVEVYSHTDTITKQNNIPTVETKLYGHTLCIDLDDDDGDFVQFKVSVNEEQVLPEAGYSSPFNPPFHVDYTLPYDSLNIGQNNRIRVDVIDSTGDGAYWEESRLIKYSGLMFRDKDGVFYTTDFGELLRYLDMGSIVANHKSETKEIYLENTYGFPVRRLKLTPIQGDLDPVYEVVELSKSEEPFEAESLLTFDDIINPGDYVSFYVRINAKELALGGGNFKVKAEADPMWQVGEI